MSKRLVVLLAGILVTGLIAAGCGGDDDETTSSTTSTTAGATGASGASGATGPQSEFAKQADAICAEGEKEDDATAEKIFADVPKGEQPTDEQFSEFVDAIAPSIQDQIDQISELTPPAGEEEAVDQFIGQANEDLQAIEDDPSLLGGDTDPFAETQQLAEELGIRECAN